MAKIYAYKDKATDLGNTVFFTKKKDIKPHVGEVMPDGKELIAIEVTGSKTTKKKPAYTRKQFLEDRGLDGEFEVMKETKERELKVSNEQE